MKGISQRQNDKPLARQITRLNTIMIVLIIILGAFAFYLNGELTERMYYYNPSVDDLDDIYIALLENENIPWKALDLPEESYVELINREYRVLDSTGQGHEPGYAYSVRVFNELINDPSSDMMVYYPYADDREMMVLFMPYRDVFMENQAALVSTIIFAAGALFIVFIISRFSAKQVITPLDRLSRALHAISQGQYGHTIDLGAGNDLDRLAEDINNLSKTIENEIAKRESLENSRQALILDISHDLKTPLTNVIGYSESLKASRSLSESDHTRLDAIIRNGVRANHLLDELFTYSKLNASQYRLDLHTYNIKHVLEDLLAGWISDIEEAGKYYDIQTELENTQAKGLAPVNLHVQLDIQNFRRALDNLIGNFIKYSGDKTTLTLQLLYAPESSDPENIVIMVSDNGIGMAPDIQKQIFSPFFRADSARSTKDGGSGLGLSITKRIIELHGGSIDLLDKPEGTHFKIKLPKFHENP